MKRIALISLLVLVVAFIAGPVRTASATERGGGSATAIFVLSNNTKHNTVVAYTRDRNGQLRVSGEFRTGGKGGVLNGAETDKLASQGALAFDRNNQKLYAVNAGDDTISTFDVRANGLRLRSIVSSGGDFPVSIATRGDLVFALNGGGAGSVQGFRANGNSLRPLPNSNRSLDLKVVTDKTQFLMTPSQIGFTPDGQRLVVTTKANGSKIDIFDLNSDGVPEAKPTVNSAANPAPFGFTFDRAGRLVVTEAGNSTLTTYAINADKTITPKGGATDGQTALCWVDNVGSNFYGANTGGDGSKTNGSITHFKLNSEGIPTVVSTVKLTDKGTTDLSASSNGRFLYALSGDKGKVQAFRVARDGALTLVSSVAVPGGADLEGLIAL